MICDYLSDTTQTDADSKVWHRGTIVSYIILQKTYILYLFLIIDITWPIMIRHDFNLAYASLVPTPPRRAVRCSGDVIVCSGLIAYLGAFTPDFRERTVREAKHGWKTAENSTEVVVVLAPSKNIYQKMADLLGSLLLCDRGDQYTIKEHTSKIDDIWSQGIYILIVCPVTKTVLKAVGLLWRRSNLLPFL